jgi:predicted DNA-binding ribbon-helix-helix protein
MSFGGALKKIASERQTTLSDLVCAIDSERQHSNLSSAIRLFVLDFHQKQFADLNEGHGATHRMVEPSVPAFSRLT